MSLPYYSNEERRRTPISINGTFSEPALGWKLSRRNNPHHVGTNNRKRRLYRKKKHRGFKYLKCRRHVHLIIVIGLALVIFVILGLLTYKLLTFFLSFSQSSKKRTSGNIVTTSAWFLSSPNERFVLGEIGTSLNQAQNFPVSVRNEDIEFETINHPVNPEVSLNVPKFWIPFLLNQKDDFMTKRVASYIGSHSSGSYSGLNARTIFVGITNFRDLQCRSTVENIFQGARYPERIRVGIVDQIKDGFESCSIAMKPCDEEPEQAMCKYSDRIDVYEMQASLATGKIFARNLVQRLYRGEYYAFQVDVHVSFVVNWDEHIINQFESLNNEMAVLSTTLTDLKVSVNEENVKPNLNSRPILCNANFEGQFYQEKALRLIDQPDSVPRISGSPQLQPYWTPEFSFSRGHFIVNVPSDMYLPMVDSGEDISTSVRGFTHGYDFYAPERALCFRISKRGERGSYVDNARLYKG
mmetsp:Transcript_27732/g.40974  ORF Transcript_27732/g.40974 Transcript_27732/m.40974 type:complete len:468 (+) Transcript_27732:108-1511(+)